MARKHSHNENTTLTGNKSTGPGITVFGWMLLLLLPSILLVIYFILSGKLVM